MPCDFTGLHVVVTGGTGALGSAVVGQLLAGGAICHVPAIDGRELDRFPHAGNDRVQVRAGVDLRSEADVVAFYSTQPELWASIHCAGGYSLAPIAGTSLADYARLQDLNATSCFLCCREAVASIRRRHGGPTGGRLVNVAARPALEPRSGGGMVAYTMSKAAVAALTVSLGEELAPEEIWVNAVVPSLLDTPANRAAMPDADHAAWPTVDDVARTLVFLASPDNRTTRSALIPVYGRS